MKRELEEIREKLKEAGLNFEAVLDDYGVVIYSKNGNPDFFGTINGAFYDAKGFVASLRVNFTDAHWEYIKAIFEIVEYVAKSNNLQFEGK